jgi:Lipase (class 3)
LHDRPASALFVHNDEKIACLAIRGTTTIHDVVTDVRQVPVPFPDLEHVAPAPISPDAEQRRTALEEGGWTNVRYQGLAVSGMAGAASNLYREHIDALMSLAQQGYRIRMTGHSLGGSVAVLLGALVKQDLERLFGQGRFDSVSEKDAILKVYAYGTPSCVDHPLAEAVESFVTSVVLHDDVVPRLTPTSCRGLLKHLLHIRETWVKVHFADDLRAFTDRAKTAWAPKWRTGFTMSASSSVNLKRYCREQLQYGTKQLRIVKDKLVGEDQRSRSSKSRVGPREVDFSANATLGTGRGIEQAKISLSVSNPVLETEPRLVMDVLGSMGGETEGMVLDDEEFFDTWGNLLYTSDEENEAEIAVLDGPTKSDTLYQESSRNSVLRADAATATSSAHSNPPHESSEGDDSKPVFLEELPLPRMFIPGKIVHIYSFRGVYKATYVPRTFRELRRISMAGNMLSDHKTKSYHDALLEVANVRSAPEYPPQWTAYDEDGTW